jgi:hypothetical protein
MLGRKYAYIIKFLRCPSLIIRIHRIDSPNGKWLYMHVVFSGTEERPDNDSTLFKAFYLLGYKGV